MTDHTAAIHAAYAAAQDWFNDQAATSPEAVNELRSRGLTVATGRRAGIGWAPTTWTGLTDHLIAAGHRRSILVAAGLSIPARIGRRHLDVFRGRVMFPYRDADGVVVGFTARRHGDQAQGPKWLNTPNNAVFDKRTRLYGMDAVTDRTAMLAITEGAWDAVTVTAVTRSRVAGIAACGTGFTAAHAAAVAAAGLPVIVATDADTAGRQAAVRIHELLAAAGVDDSRCLRLPDGMDPSSFHTARGRTALADLLRIPAAGSLTRHVIDQRADHLDPRNGPAVQLDTIRRLRSHIAPLAPGRRAAVITHLAKTTGLLALTIHDAVHGANPATEGVSP